MGWELCVFRPCAKAHGYRAQTPRTHRFAGLRAGQRQFPVRRRRSSRRPRPIAVCFSTWFSKRYTMKVETIVFAIGVLVWLVSSLIKGFKWLANRTNPAPPPQAPPPSGFQTPAQFSTSAPSPVRPQTPFQAPPPSRPSPVQALQQQAARLEQARQTEQARLMPRQPSAGGPAVPFETDRQDFERQEQDLFASEPSALGVSLSSPAAARPAAAPNKLFGGTDDLVRAIILQEVLGPPLSRRKSPPAPTSHTSL